MKRLAFVLLAVMLMFLVSQAGVEAKIRVVATIPDLADMASNIGGDLLEIKSLATGRGEYPRRAHEAELRYAAEPC